MQNTSSLSGKPPTYEHYYGSVVERILCKRILHSKRLRNPLDSARFSTGAITLTNSACQKLKCGEAVPGSQQDTTLGPQLPPPCCSCPCAALTASFAQWGDMHGRFHVCGKCSDRVRHRVVYFSRLSNPRRKRPAARTVCHVLLCELHCLRCDSYTPT